MQKHSKGRILSSDWSVNRKQWSLSLSQTNGNISAQDIRSHWSQSYSWFHAVQCEYIPLLQSERLVTFFVCCFCFPVVSSYIWIQPVVQEQVVAVQTLHSVKLCMCDEKRCIWIWIFSDSYVVIILLLLKIIS